MAGNPVLLVGVGNEHRSDDGLGIFVAREMRRRGLPGLTVVERTGDATRVLETIRGAGAALLVDAIRSGQPAGTLHRLNAREGNSLKTVPTPSSHGLGVAEALRMAGTLNVLPPVTILYGIEAQSFEEGDGLSDPVLRSIPDLLLLIEEDVRHLADA